MSKQPEKTKQEKSAERSTNEAERRKVQEKEGTKRQPTPQK